MLANPKDQRRLGILDVATCNKSLMMKNLPGENLTLNGWVLEEHFHRLLQNNDKCIYP
jgi:hypothetical protein